MGSHLGGLHLPTWSSTTSPSFSYWSTTSMWTLSTLITARHLINDIILKKLDSLGIGDKINQWISGFLKKASKSSPVWCVRVFRKGQCSALCQDWSTIKINKVGGSKNDKLQSISEGLHKELFRYRTELKEACVKVLQKVNTDRNDLQRLGGII